MPYKRVGQEVTDEDIKQWEPLCTKLAGRFVKYSTGNDFDDLMQVARMAVYQTLSSGKNGVSIMSQAIRWALIKWIDSDRPISIPAHAIASARRVTRRQGGTGETITRAMASLGMSNNDAKSAMLAMAAMMPTAEISTACHDAGVPRETVDPSDNGMAAERMTTHVAVEQYLSLLTQIERYVIESVYLRDIPQDDVAKTLGVKKQAVSALKRRALIKMATAARQDAV